MRRSLAIVVGCALCGIGVPAASAAGAPPPTTAPPPPAPGAAVPGGPPDALTLQIQQALAQQAQIDQAKAALAGEVAAANDAQKHLGTLVLANQTSIGHLLEGIASQQQRVAEQSRAAADAHERGARARARAAMDRATLSAALRLAYMSQDGMVAYVVSSQSFSDFMLRINLASHVTDQVQSLLSDLHSQEDKARIAEKQALDAGAAARGAAAILDQQRQDLEGEIGHERDLVSQLSDQASAATQEIAAADSQGAQVAQQVAQLRIQQLDRTIADAEQAAWSEAAYYLQNHLGDLPPGVTAAPTSAYSAALDKLAAAAATGEASLAGQLADDARLLWPAPGTTITQGFGPSPYAFEPAAFGVAHFHTGIDMAGPMGTPIIAPASGIVVSATPGDTGYGNHIVLALDGHSLCLFGHLEAMLVHPGDQVKAGQLIALMGSTGNSTGPHLHFEVRVDNTPVDPLPLLARLAKGAAGPPPLPTP